MNDDYYSILGVSRSVTPTELKERYRYLCHAYHPDKFANDSQRQHAENDFKRLNEAYEVLSKPDLRARYDAAYSQKSHTGSSPPRPPQEPNKFIRTLSWFWAETKELVTVIFIICVAIGTFDVVKKWWFRNTPPGSTVPLPPPELPRPADEGFMDWLVDQVVPTEKNTIYPDMRWKIERGEISEFKVVKIAENPSDKNYTATLSFRAAAKGSGVEVKECLIRYRKATEANKLQFVEFFPVSVSRFGPPPPTDEDFMGWLVGQKIITEKNMIFPDAGWKIEKGEISEFKVVRIAENPADRIYTATLSFRATAKGHGIEVKECLIRYRKATETNQPQFVDFVPVSWSRFGN